MPRMRRQDPPSDSGGHLDAVPPGVLGIVQRGVGWPEQGLDDVTILGEDGNTHRDGHAAQPLTVVRYRQLLDGLAQLLSPPQGLLSRRLRQDPQKFFAAVAADDIVASRQGPKEGAELPEERVSGLVPKRVIELLKVVDIEHDAPYGVLSPGGAPQ